MDAKLKHLELIQGVVNRLADNSFRIKRWAVLLVSALLVLSLQESRLAAHLAILPILLFWGLDSYFLWQERLFRALYDHVRGLDETDIDFSMATGPFKRSWLGANFSKTILPFYVALAVPVAIAITVPRVC